MTHVILPGNLGKDILSLMAAKCENAKFGTM
jgi:hypothetical protein